jgi:hypothetical protein
VAVECDGAVHVGADAATATARHDLLAALGEAARIEHALAT